VTHPAGTIRKLTRATVRGTALGACVVACLAEYIAAAAFGRLNDQNRPRILEKWSVRIMRCIHLQLTVSGHPPQEGLIISNHLSYLDILVFSSATSCAFVSKKEVRSWPAIGWIASLGGTVFIDRKRRAATQAIRPEMEAALSGGLRMVLFPEGTSYNGLELLPFYSSLFQPAVEVNAPVSAAFLAYHISDGDPSNDVCYWGDMTLFPHLMKLLTKESVQATVLFAPEVFHFTDRKEAARVMREQVERLRDEQRQSTLNRVEPAVQ
jgi:1-acyl-sn-glycerol-3-phosphate acyltransferase